MILLCQWYQTSDQWRNAELAGVRDANALSGVFDEVCYVDGQSKRWSYGDMVSLAARRYRGKVCVLANTDILFNDTCASLRTVVRENTVVSLTRWENDSTPNMLGHLVEIGENDVERKFFSGTQDVWAFVGGGIPAVATSIPMGKKGCDQVFVGWAAKAGCKVFCPSLDIRVKHVHAKPNDYEGVKSLSGLYGYPEMTTVAGGVGLVLVHDFPADGETRPEFIETCPR